MSQGQPAKWTQITALVRDETTFKIESAVRLPLSGSTSAKTGMAPALIMHETNVIKVRGVTITSSPGPKLHFSL